MASMITDGFKSRYKDGQNRWSQSINLDQQKRLFLSPADDDNCIKVEFSFDAELLYQTEKIQNKVFFTEGNDVNDYWWGGASTLYLAGGLTDNRDSLEYPFQPNDFVTNWGGLIEPYSGNAQ